MRECLTSWFSNKTVIYILCAKPKTRLVLFSKGKGRQKKLFQIKRRQAPKIAWFQRQRTPRRHARYSDASESFIRLARMTAIFSCADMALSSSVDCWIPQMFRSLIRIMSSPSAPTLMIIRANFTLVSASFRPAIPQPSNIRVFHRPWLCILFQIHASFEAAWRFAQASKKLSSLWVGAWQRCQNVKRYSCRERVKHAEKDI